MLRLEIGGEAKEIDIDENTCVGCEGEAHEKIHLVNATDSKDHILLPICNICFAMHKRGERTISAMTGETRELPPFPLPDMSLKDLQSIAEVGLLKKMLSDEWQGDDNFIMIASIHMRLKKLEGFMSKMSEKVIEEAGADLISAIKQMRAKLDEEKEDGQ